MAGKRKLPMGIENFREMLTGCLRISKGTILCKKLTDTACI